MQRLLTIAAVATTVVTVAIGTWRISIRDQLPDIPEEHQPTIVREWEGFFTGARQSPVDPAVAIVVFSDYLCGYCEETYHTIERVAGKHREVVAVAWRHFPILSEISRTAAIAAECANQAGRFDEIHPRLFSRADSLGLADWARTALDAGVVDTVWFSACLKSNEALEAVRQDIAHARDLGLNTVPGILLDSLLFRGTLPREYLRKYVRRASAGRTENQGKLDPQERE